jgi:hypothetical protein
MPHEAGVEDMATAVDLTEDDIIISNGNSRAF